MPAKIKPEEKEQRKAHLIARNIILLSPFTRTNYKHDFKCLVESCQHEWQTTFDSVYRGTGCPVCIGNTIGDKELDTRLKDLNFRQIYLLDYFKGSHKKHWFLCGIDNHEWQTTFKSVYEGTGCPKCAGKILDKDLLRKNLEKRNIEIIGEITRTHNIHSFCCLIDSHIWRATLDNVSRKTSCPKCSGRFTTDEQKERTKASLILRGRLRNFYAKGAIPSKVYRDENGEFNHIYMELFPYWFEQHKLLPNKPDLINKWELDHIIPCNWFDPYDIEQLKLCWHSNNFQWLSKSENSSKHANVRPKDLEVFTDWHYAAVKKASYAKPLPSLVA